MKILLFLSFIALLGMGNSIAQNSHAVTIANQVADGAYNTSYFIYTDESGTRQTVPLGEHGAKHEIKIKPGTDITIRVFVYMLNVEMVYAGIRTYSSMAGAMDCILNYKEEDSQHIEHLIKIPHRATFKCGDKTVTRDIINDGDIIEVWVISSPLDFSCCNTDALVPEQQIKPE